MNIYEKLLAIQTELKAPKSQYNSFGKYNYRNCEDILEAVKPLLVKYKAALKVSDELVMVGDRYYIKATAQLINAGGQDTTFIENTAFAREEEEKKGMDGSQVTGASSSYARKYALNGLFAIDDTKDSDTTNNGGKTEKAAETKTESNTQEQNQSTERREQETGMSYEEAATYSMKSGKYANKPFNEVPRDYLEWVSKNLSGKAMEAAKVILQTSETPKQATLTEIVDDDVPF